MSFRVSMRAHGCVYRRCGVAALALLLGSGCASAPASRDVQVVEPPRRASLAEIVAAWHDTWGEHRTLSASGELTVRDVFRGRSSQLDVRVVVARGDKLYLKGSVAIVTGVEVTSDGERFWFALPTRRKVWTGRNGTPPPPEPGELQEPYYALRPTDVTAALLPEPLDPGSDEVLLLAGQRDSFVLTLARTSGRRGVALRRVWFEREELRPQREQRFDAAGDLASDVVWRDWQEGLPRDVSIVRPLDGYQARFQLRSVRTDVDVPEQAFTGRTPEGFEVIEVES